MNLFFIVLLKMWKLGGSVAHAQASHLNTRLFENGWDFLKKFFAQTFVMSCIMESKGRDVATMSWKVKFIGKRNGVSWFYSDG